MQIEVSLVHFKTKQNMIRFTLFSLLMSSSLFVTGCSDVKKESQAKPWAMGERVPIGPFTFTVLESEWKQELTGSKGRILPKERFLVLRLSATNGGGERKSVSFLSIRDDKDKEFTEFQELEGFPGWMGILRDLPVAGTEQGLIVFDVPLGHYRLVVNDGGAPGEERSAVIDLPLSMRPDEEKQPIVGR